MNVLFDEWVRHLEVKLQQGRLKSSTKKAYLSMLRKHLRPAFGTCRSDRLSEHVVLEWERRYAALLAAGTMSPKFYNHIRGLLHVVLTWARQRGQRYLTHDPLTDVKPVPVERRERRFLEPEEITRLLDAPDNERDRAIMYLFTYTGIRRGELFALRWSDLDEHTNRIHVKRSLFQGAVTRPKTQHSERTVDIPESIVNRLRAYRETNPPLKKGYLFHSHTGSPMDPDNWYKRVFVPTAERAGLRPSERDEDDGPAVTIHTLRHTYASLLINEGESIKYVSRQLGHAKIGITSDLYGHLFRETSVSAMERLGKRIHELSTDTR